MAGELQPSFTIWTWPHHCGCGHFAFTTVVSEGAAHLPNMDGGGVWRYLLALRLGSIYIMPCWLRFLGSRRHERMVAFSPLLTGTPERLRKIYVLKARRPGALCLLKPEFGTH